MNQEEKKVGLSIRAVGEEASRAEVEEYKTNNRQPRLLQHRRRLQLAAAGGGNKGKGNKPNTPGQSSGGSSSSTTLGDLLNWKRSEREENEN